MEDFLTIFAALDCHGPASKEDTLAALDLVPSPLRAVLEIGCGPGNATLLLAENTDAQIHALDSMQQSLTRLSERTTGNLQSRITPIKGDMKKLPFATASFDAIWCENSVYVIGFERALAEWRPLLRPGGTLVVSDLVWLRDDAPSAVKEFWREEYPAMSDRKTREQQARDQGYSIVGTHELGHKAWANYYQPLAQRVDELRPKVSDPQVISSLEREIEMLKRQAEGDFNYVFFVLQPKVSRNPPVPRPRPRPR